MMPAVNRAASARLPTQFGEFVVHVYAAVGEDRPYTALVMGDIGSGRDVLVRIHSSCLTGDVFGSLRCDCGLQLERAMELIGTAGRGVLVYAEQEGRGIGIVDKIRAYALQDHGADSVEANLSLGLEADKRDYTTAIAVLKDLGVGHMRLMTNNPGKVRAVEQGGIEVSERIGLLIAPNVHNAGYLETKRLKLGHVLPDRSAA